jgi:hypothetical protein
LEQFTVDARSAPPRILRFHTPDQFTDFLSHLRAPELLRPPPPKQTETSAARTPRFRFDQDDGVSPTRIQSAQRRLKEPVRATEFRSRLLSFEDGKLLPQSCRFQCSLWRGTKKQRMYATIASTSEAIAPMVIQLPSTPAQPGSAS